MLAIGCLTPTIDGAETLSPELNAHLRSRYLGDASRAVYLIRPDQVVAARWIDPEKQALQAEIDTIWKGQPCR